jgi:uncharacterized membrane protein
MSPEMTRLLVAAILWIALHLGVAGSPLRGALIRRIGDNGYRGLFSSLSAAALVFLIWSYGRASRPETFYGLRLVEAWQLWVPILLMPIATVLLVASVTTPNPTMVGGEKILRGDDVARGIFRVTRHPMLNAFALWAAVHLVANGDLASQFLFGSILIVAVAGMSSIDRKRAKAKPEAWSKFAAATSALPFLAIAQGRNRFSPEEIGWWRVGLGLLLWVALVGGHSYVFGVSAHP